MPIPRKGPFGGETKRQEERVERIDFEEALPQAPSEEATVAPSQPESAPEPVAQPKPKEEADLAKISFGSVESNQKPELEEIDLEKKRLKPFGSRRDKARGVKRSKNGAITNSKMDNRKDRNRQATIVRTSVIGILIAIAVFGGKNAIFPPEGVQMSQVDTRIASLTNTTKFPTQRGEGFAKDFISAYMTVNSDSASARVLAYYYTGDMGATSSNSGTIPRNATSSFSQKVVYGPTVYSVRNITDSSANYVFGALVEPSVVQKEGGDSAVAPTDGSNLEWVFFSVNVYYNEENDSFAITPDSPSLVPASSVESQRDVPNAKPLGLGEEDKELANTVSSTVQGFVRGYAITSATDHSAIDQYIVTDPDPELLKGLNSDYQLSDSSSAISYQVFPSTEDKTELKVRVKVTWTYVAGTTGTTGNNESKIDYTSTYVMTMVKNGDKYLVSKFVPENYVPDLSK